MTFADSRNSVRMQPFVVCGQDASACQMLSHGHFKYRRPLRLYDGQDDDKSQPGHHTSPPGILQQLTTSTITALSLLVSQPSYAKQDGPQPMQPCSDRVTAQSGGGTLRDAWMHAVDTCRECICVASSTWCFYVGVLVVGFHLRPTLSKVPVIRDL